MIDVIPRRASWLSTLAGFLPNAPCGIRTSIRETICAHEHHITSSFNHIIEYYNALENVSLLLSQLHVMACLLS